MRRLRFRRRASKWSELELQSVIYYGNGNVGFQLDGSIEYAYRDFIRHDHGDERKHFTFDYTHAAGQASFWMRLRGSIERANGWREPQRWKGLRLFLRRLWLCGLALKQGTRVGLRG